MSTNSSGVDMPAMHHMISGDRLLFHCVASAITAAAYDGADTSAEMYRNRCVSGFLAAV